MKILFVCRGNVGRSQMAEVLLRKLTDKFEVSSAGTKLSGPEQSLQDLSPATDVVITSMKEEGLDISANIRKQLTQEMATVADRIILTIDENDPVPDYLVNNPKVEIWNIPDPKGLDLEATSKIRDLIKVKVKDLVSNVD